MMAQNNEKAHPPPTLLISTQRVVIVSVAPSVSGRPRPELPSSTKPEPEECYGVASEVEVEGEKKDEHRHHSVNEARVPGHRSEPTVHHSGRQLQHPRLLPFRHHHRRLRYRRLPLRD